MKTPLDNVDKESTMLLLAGFTGNDDPSKNYLDVDMNTNMNTNKNKKKKKKTIVTITAALIFVVCSIAAVLLLLSGRRVVL